MASCALWTFSMLNDSDCSSFLLCVPIDWNSFLRLECGVSHWWYELFPCFMLQTVRPFCFACRSIEIHFFGWSVVFLIGHLYGNHVLPFNLVCFVCHCHYSVLYNLQNHYGCRADLVAVQCRQSARYFCILEPWLLCDIAVSLVVVGCVWLLCRCFYASVMCPSG